VEKREFILNTLLPYKQDPTTCGYNMGACLYLTEDGRKCAVGKHMIDGKHQHYGGGVISLNRRYGLDNILTEEAKAIGLSVEEWEVMQEYHDAIAKREDSALDFKVMSLENISELKFPELYLEKSK
jgi:hypothetical protein